MRTPAILWFLFGSVLVFARTTNKKAVKSYRGFTYSQPIDSLSVAQGDSLFTSNCFNCHTTFISHAYDSVGWNAILTRMSVNAGLDSMQKVDLSNFIFEELSKTDSSNVIRTVGGYGQW